MLTSAQIATLARQAAKCPNYTSQSGQLLNEILSDLCQNYDFELARATFNFNFNPGLIAPIGNLNTIAGNGPYLLPANYLRAKRGDVMWFLQGVPYPMIPVDINEFDAMVEEAGNQSYPYLFATDVSQNPPIAYVWPAASGAYPVMVRYYAQMPDIGSGAAAVNGWNPGSTLPESSSVVPWFPNVGYLRKELQGRLYDLTDDDRALETLGTAERMLKKYLILKDDTSNRAKRVTLDGRRFRRNITGLPNTKATGW